MKKLNQTFNNKLYFFFLSFIFFIILFILFYYYSLWKENKIIQENFDLQQWKNTLKNNLLNSVATIMTVPPNEVRTEDCSLKCDAQNCQIMNIMKKNLTECIECHKNPKKCFRKSIIGGNCDDCLPNEQQINCKSTKEFGCTPPHNIYSYEGTLPYYIQVPDDNLNSPFDQKCIFCWQIHEYI
jgi:hypothetical protein